MCLVWTNRRVPQLTAVLCGPIGTQHAGYLHSHWGTYLTHNIDLGMNTGKSSMMGVNRVLGLSLALIVIFLTSEVSQ